MSEEPKTLQARVEQMFQARRDAISGLEEASAELSAAEQTVAVAKARMADAVSAANAAGWTTNELHDLGIVTPAPRRGAKGTTRRRRSATTLGQAPTVPRTGADELPTT